MGVGDRNFPPGHGFPIAERRAKAMLRLNAEGMDTATMEQIRDEALQIIGGERA